MLGVGTYQCHTMIVRKRTVVSGLRRIAEDGRNSVRERNSRDGIREKKFRETSQELGGWRKDGRKGLRVLRTKSLPV